MTQLSEEVVRDLELARLGDYPGAEGCKRIAAAYDIMLARLEQAEREMDAGRTILAATAIKLALRKVRSEAPTLQP